MGQFEDREKSYEAKFSHDKEQEFKAVARRNKLLGLWAAEQMGMSEDEAASYAKEVVVADFDEPGDDDVVQKVINDLHAKSVGISEHLLRKRMDELMEEARKQIASEA